MAHEFYIQFNEKEGWPPYIKHDIEISAAFHRCFTVEHNWKLVGRSVMIDHLQAFLEQEKKLEDRGLGSNEKLRKSLLVFVEEFVFEVNNHPLAFDCYLNRMVGRKDYFAKDDISSDKRFLKLIQLLPEYVEKCTFDEKVYPLVAYQLKGSDNVALIYGEFDQMDVEFGEKIEKVIEKLQNELSPKQFAQEVGAPDMGTTRNEVNIALAEMNAQQEGFYANLKQVSYLARGADFVKHIKINFYDLACKICKAHDHASAFCPCRTCFRCNNVGHSERDCYCPKTYIRCKICFEFGHAKCGSKKIRCCKCFQEGHKIANCPNQWFMKCWRCGGEHADHLCPDIVCWLCLRKGHTSVHHLKFMEEFDQWEIENGIEKTSKFAYSRMQTAEFQQARLEERRLRKEVRDETLKDAYFSGPTDLNNTPNFH